MKQLSFDQEPIQTTVRDERIERLLFGFPDAGFEPFLHVDRNPASGLKKVRKLHKPVGEMDEAHEIIRTLAAEIGAVSEYATGSVAGENSRSNVERHLGNRYFYLLDLKNAFEQIKIPVLAEILNRYGFPADLPTTEHILDRYCRKPDGRGLCMGGAASPILFNIAFFEVDKQLAELCDSHGVTYTRYLDDLTFSSRYPIGDKKRHHVRRILDAAGYEINHRKTHVHDLERAPVVIAGIQINRSGYCQLTTEYQARLTEVIDEFWDQVFVNGVALTDRQISMLGGYKGAIMPSIDYRRPEMTVFEKEILRKIEELRLSHRSKNLLEKLGKITIGHDGEPIDVMKIGHRTYTITGPNTIA